jgi:hypothetical protein
MTRLLPNLIHRRRPVGWWRCEYSSDPNFKHDGIYPCIQTGMSRDQNGKPLPAKEREFRILSEIDEYAHAPRYLGYPHHLFDSGRYQMKFSFVRRMEKREYAEILEQARPGLAAKLEEDEQSISHALHTSTKPLRKPFSLTARHAVAASLAGAILVGLLVGFT